MDTYTRPPCFKIRSTRDHWMLIFFFKKKRPPNWSQIGTPPLSLVLSSASALTLFLPGIYNLNPLISSNSNYHNNSFFHTFTSTKHNNNNQLITILNYHICNIFTALKASLNTKINTISLIFHIFIILNFNNN